MDNGKTDAVIVVYGRSAIGRAYKGSLVFTNPVDYAGQVLAGVLAKIPQARPDTIDDVVVGCSFPENTTGWNVARLIALRAGLPHGVAGQTVNRFCSSGLQAIASAANAIMAGQAEIMIAGGVENMTVNGMGLDTLVKNKWLDENLPGSYLGMGLTAENVAERYGVTRKQMEAMCVESHQKAAKARAAGKFAGEIIPVEAVNEAGEKFIFDTDEGIRETTSMEALAELKTVFKDDGLVTAATSSQMSDGAAFVVLMSAGKAEELGLQPIARFVAFAVGGVDPAYMGIGPTVAIPKVMKLSGLSVADMDVIELNEAFAAQAIPCMDMAGMDKAKVNPNGGAMAMGHPLGATGAVLTCKTLSELQRSGGRYGLVTMCIGGGMGAAGIVEYCGKE